MSLENTRKEVLKLLEESVSRVTPGPSCPTGRFCLAVCDSVYQGTEGAGAELSADRRLCRGAGRTVGAHPVCAAREGAHRQASSRPDGAQRGWGLAYLGWGFLEGYGLQDFGRSVASIPLLLYSDVFLHLINVTAKGSGQIGRGKQGQKCSWGLLSALH